MITDLLIMIQVTANQDKTSRTIIQLRMEIQNLQLELMEYKQGRTIQNVTLDELEERSETLRIKREAEKAEKATLASSVPMLLIALSLFGPFGGIQICIWTLKVFLDSKIWPKQYVFSF